MLLNGFKKWALPEISRHAGKPVLELFCQVDTAKSLKLTDGAGGVPKVL